MEIPSLPSTPFADIAFDACSSNDPNSCCRDYSEKEAKVEVNCATKTMRYSYKTGAMTLINKEFLVIRSSCLMNWFRDRYGTLHMID